MRRLPRHLSSQSAWGWLAIFCASAKAETSSFAAISSFTRPKRSRNSLAPSPFSSLFFSLVAKTAGSPKLFSLRFSLGEILSATADKGTFVGGGGGGREIEGFGGRDVVGIVAVAALLETAPPVFRSAASPGEPTTKSPLMVRI